MEIHRVSQKNLDVAVSLLRLVDSVTPKTIGQLLEPSNLCLMVEGENSLDCLLTITHADPDFDNASPYLFFRYVSRYSHRGADYLEVLYPKVEKFLASCNPRLQVMECILNEWEQKARQFLVARGFTDSNGRSFRMSKPAPDKAYALDLQAYDPRRAREYFRIDEEASAQLSKRFGRQTSMSEEEREESFRAFSSALERFAERGDFFGLRVDQDIVGFLFLRDDRIDTIVVAPAHQGKGYGAELVNFACATLKKRGFQQIWLNTSQYNLDAVRFWEGQGFRMEHFIHWFIRDLKH